MSLRIITRYQQAILAVFVAGLAINAAALFYLRIVGGVGGDTLVSLLTTLLAAYSVPFATIVGGLIASTRAAQARTRSNVLTIVIVLGLCWNLLLMVGVLQFALSDDGDPSQLTSFIRSVSEASSFLIAGTLTYAFVREPT